MCKDSYFFLDFLKFESPENDTVRKMCTQNLHGHRNLAENKPQYPENCRKEMLKTIMASVFPFKS